MADFDPDLYLAQTLQPSNQPAFDPDSYLSGTQAPKQSKLRIPQNVLGGIGRSVGQGATFGLADELVGGVGAGIAKLSGDKTPYSDLYNQLRGSIEDRNKEFKSDNPWTSGVSELVGAIPSAIATTPAAIARMASPVARVAANAGLTGLQAGVYGAGSADEGKRTEDALISGGIGLIGGAALPVASSALSAGYSGIKNAITKTAEEKAQEKASNAIINVANQAGLTPDDIARQYKELGNEATLADVNQNLLGLAKTATDKFSKGKDAAKNFYEQRQSGQQADLLNSISKRIGGAKSGDIYAALEKNQVDRAAQAKPLYDAAFKSDIDPMKFADKRIRNAGIQDALTEAEGYIANDVNRSGIPPTPVEKWHYAKKVLWDKAQALRATNPEKARLIDGQRKVVDDVLNSIPQYKQARTIWADSMDREAATEIGNGFLKSNPREFAKEYGSMSDSEKQFAQMSAINNLAEKFGNTSEKRSVHSMLTDYPTARENLKTIFGGQEGLDQFLKDTKKWDSFSTTRKVFNQNSMSAERLSEQGQSAELVKNALMGEHTSLAKKAYDKVFSGGMDSKTADVLGNILTKSNLSESELKNLFLRNESPLKTIGTKNKVTNALLTPVTYATNRK